MEDAVPGPPPHAAGRGGARPSLAWEPTFDPAGLSRPQRRGAACVVCGKRWPRPRVRAGRFPNGGGAYACEECAPAIRP
nr:hypothetical protein [Actinomadura rubrisoli]